MFEGAQSQYLRRMLQPSVFHCRKRGIWSMYISIRALSKTEEAAFGLGHVAHTNSSRQPNPVQKVFQWSAAEVLPACRLDLLQICQALATLPPTPYNLQNMREHASDGTLRVHHHGLARKRLVGEQCFHGFGYPLKAGILFRASTRSLYHTNRMSAVRKLLARFAKRRTSWCAAHNVECIVAPGICHHAIGTQRVMIDVDESMKGGDWLWQELTISAPPS
jgi:hypothetical protein